MLYKVNVQNETFVGEMISGHYHIVKDLMYFKNNLIQINFMNTGQITFTTYHDIMKLSRSEFIPYFGIEVSSVYNKIMYLKKDNAAFSPF